MKDRMKLTCWCALLLLAACSGTESNEVGKGTGGGSAAVPAEPAGWTFAVEPKPLSETVKKGLAWLAEHQHADGGYGQGEESRQMGRSLEKLAETPNVGDTCVSALAFIRSGSSPTEGPYAKHVLRAVDFVCTKVAAAPDEGLFVTDVKGTRLQMKLGTHIDTFLAAMLLAEVRGKMGDEAGNARVTAALDKVMDKLEKNQKADGRWENHGWATTLAQSMGVKGMNRAVQAGATIADTAIVAAGNSSAQLFNETDESVDAGGSAGVSLYAFASNMGSLRDSVNSSPMLERTLEKLAREAPTAKERKVAADRLAGLEKTKKVEVKVKEAVIKRLDDKRFIAGFGSNGGEEFLSYMNISESLVVAADDHWRKWDAAMTQNLNRIQNADGSWSGHHCITGRNFCTAAALLTLLADRTPVPASVVAARK